MEDKCPFCGADFVNQMSTAKGIVKLYDCHNIFDNGILYDKRHITCYERQLAALTAENQAMREVIADLMNSSNWYDDEGKKEICLFPHIRNKAQALLSPTPAVKIVRKDKP